jgi:anti-anti-sigma factor
MAEIEISKHGSSTTVRPVKNIVSSTVPDIRSEIKALIAEGVKDIVIDLEMVEIMDSMGIGLFISAHNSLLRAGGKLMVINASKDLLDLFKAMRLDQHFNISGS